MLNPQIALNSTSKSGSLTCLLSPGGWGLGCLSLSAYCLSVCSRFLSPEQLRRVASPRPPPAPSPRRPPAPLPTSRFHEGQTFDSHPHPGGFTKLPECPVTSLVVVLGFHWQWGWGSKVCPSFHVRVLPSFQQPTFQASTRHRLIFSCTCSYVICFRCNSEM